MKTMLSASLAILLAMGAAFAGPTKAKSKSANNQTLTTGAYSAQVKGIVCGGCGPAIQETMEKINGIEKVSVDQNNKTIQFHVKKDAKMAYFRSRKA